MSSIEGRRLRLRDIRLDDLEAVAYWHQPGHRWQETDAPWYPTDTAVEVAARVERLRLTITSGGFQTPRARMAVADAASDAYLGEVSRYWECRESRWPEVGISLYDPGWWNRGLGTEATGLWCDYLLGASPDWPRIGLRTWSGNPGMMRVAEKLGLRLEGRFRRVRYHDGQYYDCLGYGILREEWQALYPGGFAGQLRALEVVR
jgi:putative hydrolase of HD superfamily